MKILLFNNQECDCQEWKKYMPIIEEQQCIAQIKSYVTSYPKEGIFKFCPWCGKERITICH